MVKEDKLILIAGPCSAENRNQVFETANAIGEVDYFRAGVWKPRTMPGDFEGVGEIGLSWLSELRLSGIRVITEAATSHQVELCLKYGIDAIWIGSRTTTSPFAIQEIAESLQGVSIPVFVKNPMNPELKLWIGAIERIKRAGVNEISAIHRGFSVYGERTYRNAPIWQVPIDLKTELPFIKILCDNSHISGNRHLLKSVAQTAMNLGFDGLMTEVHINPDEALTDKQQQITPDVFKDLIGHLSFVTKNFNNSEIEILREEISSCDIELIHTIQRRLSAVQKIGRIKQRNHAATFQPDVWGKALRDRQQIAAMSGMNEEFVKDLFRLVHAESINLQIALNEETSSST